MISLRKFIGKKLVSAVRNGDFAHAGEEEAIDMVFAPLAKSNHRKILDVGCGLGGTADYIQRQGWGKVVGFDIEQEAIDYARQRYPDIEFIKSDVMYLCYQNIAQ